jgi:hypothetical protein
MNMQGNSGDNRRRMENKDKEKNLKYRSIKGCLREQRPINYNKWQWQKYYEEVYLPASLRMSFHSQT